MTSTVDWDAVLVIGLCFLLIGVIQSVVGIGALLLWAFHK